MRQKRTQPRELRHRDFGVAILAAGSSSRLGRPKQLVAYHGRPLLRHLAREALASGAGPVVVALGAGAERLSAILEGLDLRLLPNPDWAEGVASSVRLCAEWASESNPPLAGLIFMTCDQPAVTARHIDRLLEVATSAPDRIVASRYAGTLGVPALFGREFFPRLMRLHGDSGAKKLILEHSDAVLSVPLPGGELDIDSERDLESLRLAERDSPSREDSKRLDREEGPL